MIIQWLDTIIGALPEYVNAQSPTYYTQYYAIIRYIIAGVVLIFMMTCFYRVLIALFGGWIRR